MSESAIAEVKPDLLVLESEATLTSLLLIGSTITLLFGALLLVVANTLELVELSLLVLVELILLDRSTVVTILSLELIVDLDEVAPSDDLEIKFDLLDEAEGVDKVTLLRTLVGIVLVVDLVVDSDDEDDPEFIDGICVLLNVGVEVLADLSVRLETVDMVVLGLLLRVVLVLLPLVEDLEV